MVKGAQSPDDVDAAYHQMDMSLPKHTAPRPSGTVTPVEDDQELRPKNFKGEAQEPDTMKALGAKEIRISISYQE